MCSICKNMVCKFKFGCKIMKYYSYSHNKS